MTTLTRDQATAAVAAAVAERDTIQSNLIDLDNSFGKRMLAGATLAGESAQRWGAVNDALGQLWETFNAYSAVVDRAAASAANLGRSPGARLTEISELLTGPSVMLARPLAPLGQRELTAVPSTDITLATAVTQMRRAYRDAAALCASAETVWNDIAERLQQAGSGLDAAEAQTAGLADDQLASALDVARANLTQLRDRLNHDPLSFWRNGRTDTGAADQLRAQVAGAAARAAELDRLRADASRRIAALQVAAAAAAGAWQDAAAAQQRAAVRVAGAVTEPLADAAGLAGRVSALQDLATAGRWGRLANELDAAAAEISAATQRYRGAEAAAKALVARRDELRGLLDAYQAKAGRLGAAENEQLAALHERAKTMLWTAPCDLAEAADAVSGYQHAVLALDSTGRRP